MSRGVVLLAFLVACGSPASESIGTGQGGSGGTILGGSGGAPGGAIGSAGTGGAVSGGEGGQVQGTGGTAQAGTSGGVPAWHCGRAGECDPIAQAGCQQPTPFCMGNPQATAASTTFKCSGSRAGYGLGHACTINGADLTTCDLGLVCALTDPVGGLSTCQKVCEADIQCPKGQTCKAVNRCSADGPIDIGYCAP